MFAWLELVTVLVKAIAVPSGLLAGAPLIATLGGEGAVAAATLMLWLAAPAAPSPSVTFRVTTKVPALLGVKLKFALVPEATLVPLQVTFQAQWKPAAVSAVLGLEILPVREIGVPIWPLVGAPLIVTRGATSVTVMVWLAVPVVLS
jgi:hypothetical protein